MAPTRHRSYGSAGCLFLLVVYAIVATIGGVCFDYSLDAITGKDVPWYADAVAGVVASPIVVPTAVVCWIVELSGEETPFFGKEDGTEAP